MPKISIVFEFTAAEAQAIDTLRGPVPLDEFMREAAALGILSFKAEAVRKTQEQSYAGMTTRTRDFQSFRQAVELVPSSGNGEARKQTEPAP